MMLYSIVDIGPILYSPEHYLVNTDALSPHQGHDLHVFILSEQLATATEILAREEIWGSNPYTPDSDAVCILQHSGLFDVKSEIADDVLAIKLVLRIQPGENILMGSERHGLHSKSGASNVTLSALQFELVSDSSLQPVIEGLKFEMKLGPPRAHASSGVPGITVVDGPDESKMVVDDGVHPTNGDNGVISSTTSTTVPSVMTVPSLVPPPTKRTKRSRKSGAELDPRVTIDVLPDTILQFNLSNELSFQYNLNLICDRGIEPAQWTSHRLRNAVLMLETGRQRFELSWEDSSSGKSANTTNGQQYDTYRFALVKEPTLKTRSWHTSQSVPLSSDHATPVHSHLDWSQIVWGPAVVTINGSSYPLKRIFWIARSDGDVSSSNVADSAEHPSA